MSVSAYQFVRLFSSLSLNASFSLDHRYAIKKPIDMLLGTSRAQCRQMDSTCVRVAVLVVYR